VAVSILDDAFGHHVWATLRVIDECSSLSDEELVRPTVGTYGSILETLRHIVGSDAWYLFVITAGRMPRIDEDSMDLDELRRQIQRHGEEWSSILAGEPDPSSDIVAPRSDGTEGHAPAGIRLGQVLHHGTDHRSQICTALTAIGREPPDIDLWAYGEERGLVFEVGEDGAQLS
jgi:uncharacterized damage-inducible protein DinB